jgi:hypothetical protein
MTSQKPAEKISEPTSNISEPEKPTCGIIMPISPMGSYSSEHWEEVLIILEEVANEAGFKPNLVSSANESGIIQGRIVQNIFKNEIVICDVSGKNPNVMFELGMRLAADKAAIVIKDSDTDYSFDTSQIEHVSYPTDMNYHKILEFRKVLRNKLDATYKASLEPGYSTFVKHFIDFKVKKLEEKEIGEDDYIIRTLQEIKDNQEKLVTKLNSDDYKTIPRRYLDDIIWNSKNDTDVLFTKDSEGNWVRMKSSIPVERIRARRLVPKLTKDSSDDLVGV